jgi:hypothetical protein
MRKILKRTRYNRLIRRYWRWKGHAMSKLKMQKRRPKTSRSTGWKGKRLFSN